MPKTMLIDALHQEETRVVILGESEHMEMFDFVTSSKEQIKGNIYLAKITRIEPSLQAAFVEYGGGKQGFLPFSEIHSDYYQIPVSDREKLREEQLEAAKKEEAVEDEAENAKDLEAMEKKPRSRRRYGRGKPKAAARKDEEGATLSSEEIKAPDEADVKAVDGALPAETSDKKDSNNKVLTEEPKVKDEASSAAEGTSASDKNTDKKEVAKDATTSDKEVSSETDKEAPAKDTKAVEKASDVQAAQNTESSDDLEDAVDDAPAVETLDEDEEIIEKHKVKNDAFIRRYKIQEVIKHNQIILVQVIKEERGNKGASLSTYISIPGRYSVLMPNSPKGGGVSRKVPRGEEHRRLKAIASEFKEDRGMSAIIRTAGINRTKPEIKRDYDYLIKLWTQIRELAISSTAPANVYEEGNIIKRSIRDHYTSDIETIQVQGDDAYKSAKDFMKILMPSHAVRVKHYKDETPIFHQYDVEWQLQEMHQPTAKLKSGGYLVINPTEALISIDVNSGRSTTERNVEETALKTNLEAAAEVARQLSLRDLGGLVVIDFIDMYHGKNRRALERAFKDALKDDRAKIQVGRVSPFGLIEMSRQRLRPSISEATTITCPSCEGAGVVRSNNSLALEIIRHIKKEAGTGDFKEIRVYLSKDLAVFMLNESRGYVDEIETKYNVKITFKVADGNLVGTAQYLIERILPNGNIARADKAPARRSRKRPRRGARAGKPAPKQEHGNKTEDKKPSPNDKQVVAAENKKDDANEGAKDEGKEGSSKPKSRGRRYPRRSRKPDDQAKKSNDNAEANTAKTDAVSSDASNAASKSDVAAKDKAESRAKKPAKESKPVAKKQEAPKVKDAPEVTAEIKKKPVDKDEVHKIHQMPEEAKVEAKSVGKKESSRKGWWRRATK